MLKTFNFFYSLILYLILFCLTSCSSANNFDTGGAFFTKEYDNLFLTLLNKNENEISEKIDKAFTQIFYGDDSTERLYYPVGSDMAYIEDVLHNDVRSEGMSYGMMIAVQLDKQKEFNCLWKWAKTFMQHKDGASKNYFAWQLTPEGEIIDSTSASDGEEWFVTALLFASARWGDDEGIFNYKKEAQIILDAMLHKESEAENDGIITSMFNKNEKMVVFVPEVQANWFTDPSYHLPHFYELWAAFADKDNQFWCEAASVSREYFKKAVHPETGLAPDYSNFDGTPVNPWGGGNNNFQYDAWRVAMNIAVDYQWFRRDDWAVSQSNNLLNFFYKKGIKNYFNIYTLDGKELSKDRSSGLIAMNAVAALACDLDIRKEFVNELWELNIPSGMYRYYDGMLYMLGLLQVSGNFKIYLPGHNFRICNYN